MQHNRCSNLGLYVITSQACNDSLEAIFISFFALVASISKPAEETDETANYNNENGCICSEPAKKIRLILVFKLLDFLGKLLFIQCSNSCIFGWGCLHRSRYRRSEFRRSFTC